MYSRILEKTIKEKLFKGKIIIVYGPRQVGKTTLVKKIFNEFDGKKIYIQGDIPSERESISAPEPLILKKVFGDAKLVIIDEAQNIENIGLVLKTFFDRFPEVQIIATGSASFDLANKIREPLTGRALEYMMYPLSIQEIKNSKGAVFIHSNKENFLRYGMFPAILGKGHEESIESLGILENNTLYKDIFALENIKKPKVLQDIVAYLAFSIGSTVTINGIANDVKSSAATVERYLDILEKMFVIVRLYGYSNNKINEIKKGFKVYFVDTGIRNSIAKSFNRLEDRQDTGQIFENFFVIERLKYNSYNNNFVNKYFWQGLRGVEVDYLEEKNNNLRAFECKFKERKSKSIHMFQNKYKEAQIDIVTFENFTDFLS